MKILILSDVHGNLDAFKAIRETYDELWVLGDIVNYGPQPRETLEAVMAAASVVIQGNHDHAVGHDDDTRWSAALREVAEVTRRFTSVQLNSQQKAWLRELPLNTRLEREGTLFHLVHATPSDPHYGRLEPDSDEWAVELEQINADVLLVGHSHVPLIRRVGDKLIVNPGSVGQSGSGNAHASYAIWQDGVFTLHTTPYPVDMTIEKLRSLCYPPPVEQALIRTLRTGTLGPHSPVRQRN
jgi:putative phosphoesterase